MKTDYTTVLLGSLVIAFISSFVGNYFGTRNKVAEKSCNERRHMCNNLLMEKINHLVEAVEKIEKKVDKLTIG